VRLRSISVIVPVVLAALAASAPASAAPTYPPGGPGDLQVSATRVVPGAPVTISGAGFAAGGKITVTTTRSAQALGAGGRGVGFAAALPAQLATAVWGTVTANSSGVATASVKLTEPGTWTVTFRGPNADGGTRVLNTRVVVTGSAGQSQLSKTGANLTFLWAGLGLLVAGGALVSLARLRRRVRI